MIKRLEISTSFSVTFHLLWSTGTGSCHLADSLIQRDTGRLWSRLESVLESSLNRDATNVLMGESYFKCIV